MPISSVKWRWIPGACDEYTFAQNRCGFVLCPPGIRRGDGGAALDRAAKSRILENGLALRGCRLRAAGAPVRQIFRRSRRGPRPAGHRAGTSDVELQGLVGAPGGPAVRSHPLLRLRRAGGPATRCRPGNVAWARPPVPAYAQLQRAEQSGRLRVRLLRPDLRLGSLSGPAVQQMVPRRTGLDRSSGADEGKAAGGRFRHESENRQLGLARGPSRSPAGRVPRARPVRRGARMARLPGFRF